MFFENGPLKFCKVISYSILPFSVAVNIYIMTFAYRRNINSVFARAYFTEEIAIQFGWTWLAI
jgi:hypothetical protein